METKPQTDPDTRTYQQIYSAVILVEEHHASGDSALSGKILYDGELLTAYCYYNRLFKDARVGAEEFVRQEVAKRVGQMRAHQVTRATEALLEAILAEKGIASEIARFREVHVRLSRYRGEASPVKGSICEGNST